MASAEVNDPDSPPPRATCAVVGTISANRLFLEPHGNYNPNYDKTSLETSKVQFQLVSPALHPEFDADFKRGVKNLEAIQKMAYKEGPAAEHLIIVEAGRKALKFSWPLFEKRVCA